MEKPPIRRRGLALGLVVLATLVTFVAMFSVWVNRQLLNTDNWTATSSELLANETIRERVATFLTDELYANVDVQEEIRSALPPRLQPLAGPAAGGLRSLAERAAEELLARPRAQEAWEAANRAAHELLIKTLEGGGPVVSTTGGVVSLDLKELLTQMQERVGIGGRLAGALPEDAAQLTILESDQLDYAQAAYDTLRPLPIVLVSLALLLFAGALLASKGWRREAVRAYGFGLLLSGGLALAALSMLGDTVTVSLARTEAAEPAIGEVWTLSTSLLREIGQATIFYGLLMFGGALLAGPTSGATAIRRGLAPFLREPAWAYGAMAVILGIVILWWAPTPAMRNPPTALILIALILFGFEALRRRTAKEFPDADAGEAARSARARLSRAAASVGGRGGNGSGAAPASAAAVAVASPDEIRLERLERLGRLHAAGTVDDAEFRAEKARILG